MVQKIHVCFSPLFFYVVTTPEISYNIPPFTAFKISIILKGMPCNVLEK